MKLIKKNILYILIIFSSFTYAQQIDSVLLSNEKYKILHSSIPYEMHGQTFNKSLKFEVIEKNITKKTIYTDKGLFRNTFRLFKKIENLFHTDSSMLSVLFFGTYTSSPGYQLFTFIKITPDNFKTVCSDSTNNWLYRIYGKIQKDYNNKIIINHDKFNLILANHNFSFILPVYLTENDTDISMNINYSLIEKEEDAFVFNILGGYKDCHTTKRRNWDDFEVSIFPFIDSPDSVASKIVVKRTSLIKILYSAIPKSLIDSSDTQKALNSFSKGSGMTKDDYFNKNWNYKTRWRIKVEIDGKTGWVNKILDFRNLGIPDFG